MLVAAIGFPSHDLPAGFSDVVGPLEAGGQVVDLDAVDPGTPLEDPPSGAVAVIARTATDLRRAASLAALLPKAAHLVVAVTTSLADPPFALPAVGEDWRALLSCQARRGPDGEWSVEARFRRARPAGEFVAALVRGIGGHRVQAPQGPRVALAGPGAAHWRPGDPGVTLTTVSGPLGDPDEPPPADLVLRSTEPDPSPWSDPRVRVVDRPRAEWLVAPCLPRTAADGETTARVPSEVDAVPPVDERSVNPMGFVSTPELGTGVLARTGDRWAVRMGSDDLVRFEPSGAVTDVDVARLRQLRAVCVEWDPHPGALAAVRVVAGLAAAGIPLRTAHVPPWAAALGTELADLLTRVDEEDLADALGREEHSIRLRRAALRTHSSQARWRNLARAAGLAVPARPKVSVILCTRRPEFVGFALGQIAHQRDVDLEVILTLHGVPADVPEIKAAVAGFDRPITVVEVAADVPFGGALNQGVARASGRYVAKWDDDDWYGPDFLADMLLASSYTGAELVGCRAQLVYLGQIDLTVYRPSRSEWMTRLISGGTFVMERYAFDSVGGFPLVSRSVDAAMLDVFLAAGARIYRTHALGYMLHRRVTGHTWNQPVTYFLRSVASQWRGLRRTAFVEPNQPPA
jgi:Glycosyl transferase family 2